MTILLMVLLSILALGMLSISTVTLRSTSRSDAMAEARANARMALMMAIGELQKQMGPDQRISANAAILDGDPETEEIDDILHKHWVGVWESWKAGGTTGSAHSTIQGVSEGDMHPDYPKKRADNSADGYFRSWLVSLPEGDRTSIGAATNPVETLLPSLNPDKDTNSVFLVHEGSLGDLNDTSNPNDLSDSVAAGLIEVEPDGNPATPAGRYAWWVGDESQKARVMTDSYAAQTSLTSAETIFRAQAPASTGTKAVTGLENISDDSQIETLPTVKSLDLVEGVTGRPAQDNFHSITTNSFGVLSDVREGGLKRDLNTLLERPIKTLADEVDVPNKDDFMLYKFNGAEERVPIQDLSAFYQLYRDNGSNFSTGGRGGIKYTSNALSGSIQAAVPDYGASPQEYLREYTALYRNPVPVKVQFVLGVGASLLTQGQKDYANWWLGTGGKPPLGPDDKYKLSLGVKPVVSLWNPNNVPMVMETGATQDMQVGFPPFVIRWKKYKATGGEFVSKYVNLNFAVTNESGIGDGRARSLDPYIIKIRYAQNEPIVFEPGEIKTFTVDIPEVNWLEQDGYASYGNRSLYKSQEFLPDGFYVTAKVAPTSNTSDIVKIEGDNGNTTIPTSGNGGYQGYRMIFQENDKITIAAYPESDDSWSQAVARGNEIRGAGLQFFMKNKDADNRHRNYQFISRFGQNGESYTQQTTTDFNAGLILKGFPEGKFIDFESKTDAMPGASGSGNIKSFTDSGAARGLLMFTMVPGAELNNQYTGGFSSGRRITTRPFLHGSTIGAPQIADNSPAALYDYGWEWQVEKINDTEEVLQDDGESRGYYGGGYSFGTGTTHVVQQYLPVLPPISIASLSSSHLGGYSLANNPVVTGDIKNAELLVDYRQTTATGQGGLAPRNLQAIGNSYAHPNIKPNQAFKTYTRVLNTDVPVEDQKFTYVDHSYLVNKALWDEYFFSSITPQSTDVELQDAGANKTAFEVAEDFLFSDDPQPLPNRRMSPYSNNLDSAQFNLLEDQYGEFSDGFADKVAAHLMVKGPFNINSTSVEAWKVVLTSLRDTSVAYFDETSGDVTTNTPAGETPVGPGMLPNNEPILSGGITSDPADPLDQWTSWRSLSNTEIEELAAAIVKQVKKRGPFLSLSEFINRRLDDTKRDLAVKGALQAAIDDESVSINAEFRTAQRSLDGEADDLAAAGFTPEFPEALDGPVAYGSTPYIDQADILRQLGSTLTPRGDTYVIRTYGDKLDASGEVVARAWCEAIVQRTPDYVDLLSDENHFTQERLDSEANRTFGREFKITSFRWLSEKEI